MIEAQQLTRKYGDFTAVDGVSFTVNEGEIVGILGPNGAGKTTMIRMITGFLPPTEGRVTVDGNDLATDSLEVRRSLGYLPENVALYTEMRVSEYLAYRAQLEGMTKNETRRRLPEVLERTLLTDVNHQIIGTLSKGYRQRVGLATAILHRPRVLVLDEPTVGLDPRQIVAIRELIRELAQESTLLLSTHILPEVELLCDRVMIIDGGRIVAEGTPDSLRASWSGGASLAVTLKGAERDGLAALSGLQGVSAVRPTDGQPERFEVECADGEDPREAIFRAAVANDWVLLELAQNQVSLEEVFVRLTTREGATASGTVDEEEVS